MPVVSTVKRSRATCAAAPTATTAAATLRACASKQTLLQLQPPSSLALLPASAQQQRGPRALASAVTAHCTVRDASHFKALQLRGAAAAVAAGLARMCDPARRRELTQPCHLSGRTRGMLLLHHPGKFPERCIGPVEYLWSPGAQKPTDAEPRLLWLWVHPAAHAELAAALRSSAASGGGGSGGGGGGGNGKCEVEVGAGAACPQLVRLELRGRGAAAAAGRALAPHVQGGGGGAHDAGGYAAAARVNGAVWRGLTDGAAAHAQQLQPGTVLALTVLDPRELRFGPGGQSSCPPRVGGGDDAAPAPMQSAGEGERSVCKPLQRLKEIRGVIALSPLWDPAVRQFATAAIAAAPDHVLNARAASQRGWQAAPPATAAPAAEAAAAAAAAMLCAPVLTIKCGAALHPGGSSGRGSGAGLTKGEDALFEGLSNEAAAQQGWDIVAPAGWGAPLWRALVHAGARPVGEEEVEQLHVEAAMPLFPRDYSETAAGEAFWAGHAAAACAAAQRTRAHHLGRLADPSSHRPNFKSILGVESHRGGSAADSDGGDADADDDAVRCRR
ncbi:hypothetical protein JKP88DRAFT_291905 [Tribonema minus]|uniref:POPLD domain-containing protein n=1 Tax=Tribonema minus TaxID=303371 RepID=A0A836CPU3_9STRA|nr:hypothetical protein JKP88DRAFT_291905 [Tribonema minus]